MQRPSLAGLIALLLGLMTADIGAQIRIDQPPSNAILLVDDPYITVSGIADQPFTLLVIDGKNKHSPVQVTPANRQWKTLVKVPIDRAFQLVAIGKGAQSAPVVATAIGHLSRSAPPVVSLTWTSEVDDVLLSIGNATLDGNFDEDLFVTEVKDTAADLLRQFLHLLGASLVAPENDAKQFRIRVVAEDTEMRYGWTPDPDCGNPRPEGEAEVYVGTLKALIRVESDAWSPMRRDDPSTLRAQDLGWILASTSFHEVLHGLGLVTCEWMEARPDDHNPPDFLFQHVLQAKRFGGGEFWMDAGVYVPEYRRFGEMESKNRGGHRVQRAFSPFNSGYLQILLDP